MIIIIIIIITIIITIIIIIIIITIVCGKRVESIAHVVAECEKLAQNKYKNWRHDRIGKVIHWELCRKYGFNCTEKWYDHIPESVSENEKAKILWDLEFKRVSS